MVVKRFPPVNFADEEGLLAVGGDLEVETLLTAYKNGIFPWPLQKEPILWFAPPERAILFYQDLHISKKLKKFLSKKPYTFKVNKNFEAVIYACSTSPNRKNQQGTWITSQMIQAYIDLHQAGYAMSFEAYDHQGILVGGMYGVKIGQMFAGESMFYTQDNASKFALIEAISYLHAQGIDWIDIQMLTPLLESLGACLIKREVFMEMLKKALSEQSL